MFEIGIAWFVIPLTFSWRLFDGYIIFNSWRLFVAVGSLPSFFAACFIYNISESPKFLMTQGQNNKALQVFKNIYKWNKGKRGETYPVSNSKHLYSCNLCSICKHSIESLILRRVHLCSFYNIL